LSGLLKDHHAAAASHHDATLNNAASSYTTSVDSTERFVEFIEAWGQRYPAVVRRGESAWAEFVPFLAFDREIRTIICTTNAIESLNSRYRRAVNAPGTLPD
jgi:putative transposase